MNNYSLALNANFQLVALLLLACALTACSSTGSGSALASKPVVATSASELPDIVRGNDLYMVDFSYAGYRNGEASLPEPSGTIFDVSDYGAVANDGLDDSKSILQAIAAANQYAGPVVVRFPAGRFIVSDIIYIERSDFSIQGDTQGKTTLFYSRPMKFLPVPPQLKELSEYLVKFDKRERQPQNNIDLPFSLYAWTGGFIWTQVPNARGKEYLDEYDRPSMAITDIVSGARASKTITVADASKIKVGDVVKIEWYNPEGEQGSILTAMYGDRSKVAKIGSHHWNYPHRPLVTQMTRIKAVSGNSITLTDPLTMHANPAWKPKLVEWPHLENVFISDLNIEFPNGIRVAHHVEDGFNAMYLTSLFDSYVRNVTIKNADSGIITDDNANLTIENITTKGEHRAHYTVHMGENYNVLAKNITVENVAEHPLSFNTYAVKSVYKDSVVKQAPLLDQHSGANHQNLFDNIKVYLSVDEGADAAKLFDGGGAGYWKPSHGRFSTFYNIEVVLQGGSNPFTLTGPSDGVQARLLGVHGNREFNIQYGPDAHIEQLNQRPSVPSLYDFQLQRRLAE